jgi:prevent-host-death family protein
MKTISISQLKARLSAELQKVRRGTELIVTDRGRPVAKLVPLAAAHDELDELVEQGLVSAGTRKLPRNFFARERPADARARVREAVLDEREAGP